jgi:hypothetical protein
LDGAEYAHLPIQKMASYGMPRLWVAAEHYRFVQGGCSGQSKPLSGYDTVIGTTGVFGASSAVRFSLWCGGNKIFTARRSYNSFSILYLQSP